jgi:hypothetical protein
MAAAAVTLGRSIVDQKLRATVKRCSQLAGLAYDMFGFFATIF